MGYRQGRRLGMRDRNVVKIDPYGYQYGTECYVYYEVEHPYAHGLFGVVAYSDGFFVIWRPNRNVTSDSLTIEIMGGYWDPVCYPTQEEACASIEEKWIPEFKVPEKRRQRTRDAQKRKVYAWEWHMAKFASPEQDFDHGRKVVTATTLGYRWRSKRYIREFLARVCAELGEREPELRFRTGGRASTAGYDGIRLLPTHMCELVLLHELAHILHDRWNHKTEAAEQAHGQEFVGILCYLVIRFGGADDTKVRKSLATGPKGPVKCKFPPKYHEWVGGTTQMQEAACPTT